ncbi:endonuclease MutS2 [Candidatus Nitrospira inopinata]|uniref:Endonuclease MutS2 n=1 Tax=Candidatus Nitrospira inopinata TaxID=1715989 RepID=A0A0S4KXT1_9BACT|nr:Smr/MutS family protein [Candidatus Nitrospira inopinata]CUQ68128.1 Endonuclease MutS2 [Candidatus Nitrospira inopinata]
MNHGQLKTAQALEWPRVLELLKQHAQSTLGKELCGSLPLADDLGSARLRQQETTEMAELLKSDEPMPSLGFPDIRENLARAAKGGELAAHELGNCAAVMALMDETARFMSRHAAEARALARVAEPLQALAKELRPVRSAIDEAIESDGTMKESATPELRRLTHHAHELKWKIRERLDRILHSQSYKEILQELYFVQREGRYVLPVKADMRGRVPGIVHDVSVSGATVFIEPRELIDLNNAIKVADLDVEREIRRILRELTASVAEKADSIGEGVERLAEWDCIQAKAGLSRRLKCSPVALNAEGRVVLKQARHPLLMVAREEVVPNDIIADETVRVLVISGPNTGGKTVTLKIVGLYSLMARAGLHLPCAPESEMALFTECHADIGDAQDISRDLSSFSAHILQIVELLSERGKHGESLEPQAPRSLVLLDEPVTSTDPEEGAALAGAVLCRLAALGMKVVATTHYGLLKELAQTTPGFANASVGFDVERLAPTYRLFLGIPGSSSALEIAGRLGMDEAILNDARRRLRQDDRRLERLMADLQLKQRQLAEEIERARRARVESEQAAAEAKALQAQLEQTEGEVRKGLRKKLGEHLQRARAEVQATVDAIKREQKLVKAKEAKQRLSEIEERVRREVAPIGEPIPVERLKVGDTVEIVGLGMIGRLLESPQGKKRVRVKVGDGEIVAAVSGLTGLSRQTDGGASDMSSMSSTGRRPQVPIGLEASADTDAVVDVRGQAADDALDQVIAALDRAVLGQASFLRIIHGHGTGRLKSVLREYLSGSPYVASFRSGDRTEGGDGVTVVKLV